MAALLKDMADTAASGYSAYEAFDKTGAFAPYVCKMIKVGEQTGRLEDALSAVSSYCFSKIEAQEQLRLSVLHPSLLFLIMTGVVLILLGKVLPVMEQVYVQMGAGMSGAGALLLSVSRLLLPAMPVVLFLFALAAGLLAAFAFSSKFRAAVTDRWQKNEKGVWALSAKADLIRSLSMGLASGLSTEDAMGLALEVACDRPQLKKAAELCKEELSKGVPLYEALCGAGLLSSPDAAILSAGFRSGRGDEAVAEAAESLTKQAADKLQERMASVEPVLVIVLCVITGAILLSVMLPLLDIMSAIG